MDTPGFDPFAASNAERAAAIKRRVGEQLMEKTVAEWMAIFERAGAPTSPVYLPEDLDEDEQAQLHMVELQHPVTGRQRQVAPIVELSATPSSIAGPAPLLGNANDDFFGELVD